MDLWQELLVVFVAAVLWKIASMACDSVHRRRCQADGTEFDPRSAVPTCVCGSHCLCVRGRRRMGTRLSTPSVRPVWEPTASRIDQRTCALQKQPGVTSPYLSAAGEPPANTASHRSTTPSQVFRAGLDHRDSAAATRLRWVPMPCFPHSPVQSSQPGNLVLGMCKRWHIEPSHPRPGDHPCTTLYHRHDLPPHLRRSVPPAVCALPPAHGRTGCAPAERGDTRTSPPFPTPRSQATHVLAVLFHSTMALT